MKAELLNIVSEVAGTTKLTELTKEQLIEVSTKVVTLGRDLMDKVRDYTKISACTVVGSNKLMPVNAALHIHLGRYLEVYNFYKRVQDLLKSV